MRRFLQCLSLLAWLTVSSLALAYVWIRSPDSWNPIPRWIWEWVERNVEIGCCEQAADVEYFVVLGAAILTMVVATAVIGLAVKCATCRGRCRTVPHPRAKQ